MPPAAARGIALYVRSAQGYCICLKPNKVKKAPPAADLLGGWGRRQLCPALSPSQKSGESSSTRFLPDAGTPPSWELLPLCAGIGNARGLGLE